LASNSDSVAFWLVSFNKKRTDLSNQNHYVSYDENLAPVTQRLA
jgi:hypothetical protein